MRIYALGDLHLSGKQEKPMDIFGYHWLNHQQKIKDNWLKIVRPEDIVAIPGDISWAMTDAEVTVDLQWIAGLPGKKVLVRGNHDYWWKKITQLNTMYENMFFIQNNAIQYENYIFCGSRGWVCPGSVPFSDQDEKIYNRELQRLELSLKSLPVTVDNEVIVIMHFPPVNEKRERSGFIELYEKYHVSKVVYGHLHDQKSFSNALMGPWNGIEYHLVSADYVDFSPKRVG